MTATGVQGPGSSAPPSTAGGGRFAALHGLGPDGSRLFVARALRMLAYGGLAVILVVYLEQLGLDAATIGILLALTLIGDTLVSLWLTTHADRLGRRKVLVVGSFLMAGAAVVFAFTDLAPLLLIAAMIGVISPSGKEVGPFLAVEQASLTRLVPDRRRTSVFAWYNLVGSVMAAIGALLTGLTVQLLRDAGSSALDADRAIVLAYGVVGLGLALVFVGLTTAVEIPHAERSTVAGRLGLHRSRGIVARLSALFALDAFAGGFILDSLVAYWFATRFSVEPAFIGAIFFGTNILAAISALAAVWIAARIGLIRTMVYTHLPSNVLLILVPFMPTAPLAVLALFARSTISQMDVPTRQSYTMAVVDPDERSAAAGVTGIARTTGQAISPIIAAPIVASATFAGAGFVIAGSLKIVYDITLWALFRSRPAPEEEARATKARVGEGRVVGAEARAGDAGARGVGARAADAGARGVGARAAEGASEVRARDLEARAPEGAAEAPVGDERVGDAGAPELVSEPRAAEAEARGGDARVGDVGAMAAGADTKQLGTHQAGTRQRASAGQPGIVDTAMGPDT